MDTKYILYSYDVLVKSFFVIMFKKVSFLKFSIAPFKLVPDI